MRGATECAKRLKLLFSSLRSKLGKVAHPPASDPITQLILGVLSRDTRESKAHEGLDRLRGIVVDYNELRVIPPMELADLLSDFPDARLKGEDISRALNRVFAKEHLVSLDGLKELSKKDLAARLEEIDGLDAYTRARIRLLGLGQHAIPLDEAMWAYARAQEIVDHRCPLDEAQAFLERQIAQGDALEFVALVKKQAWEEMGAAVDAGEVERISSVPPDRTTRNMLQMITTGIPAEVAEQDEASQLAPAVAGAEPTQAAPPPKPKPKAKAKGARATGARKSASKPEKAKRKTTPKAAAKRKTTRKKSGAKATRKAKSRSKPKASGSSRKTTRKTSKKKTAQRKTARQTARKSARSSRKAKSA